MSQPDPFDFSEYNVEPVEEAPIRRETNAPFLAALVGLALLTLLVIAGGVGYFVWRDVQTKREAEVKAAKDANDRAELERLRLEIELQTALLARTAVQADAQKGGKGEEAARFFADELARLIRLKSEGAIGELEYKQLREKLNQDHADKRATEISFMALDDPECQRIRRQLGDLKGRYNAMVGRHPEWGEAKYK